LARIDPTRALGRPLSAVLVTLLGAGWLFGGVAEDVTDKEGIALADPGWLHDLGAVAPVVRTTETGQSRHIYQRFC